MTSANRGKRFEQILINNALRLNWDFIQIPTGAKWVSRFKVIPRPVPFDFVLVYDWPNVIFCDAKQTKNKSFPKDKIKPHQLSMLRKLYNRHFIAGYIVNFETLDQTIFFDAHLLSECAAGKHKNLKPEQGLLIGNNSQINLTMLTKRLGALSI